MRFNVGAYITVNEPTKDLIDWCRNNLIISNPDYYKKEQLGKWLGDTPSYLHLFEKVGDSIHIPFGCLRELWLLNNDSNTSWEASFKPIRRFDYDSHINLYSYQEKAIQATLARKNGILVMPCGSGKTQSGLEIISRVGGRALWLTHTQDLLNQSRKRAEDVLGNVGEGVITGGKVSIGSGITFATVQTMSKLDLSSYKDCWDIIIVDECQHCAGSPTRVTQFYRVVNNLSARYKIGLTATPKRSDGLEKSMFALLGEVIHEVDRNEVKNTTCPIRVKQVETNWFPSEDVLMWDGTIDYNKVVEELTESDSRMDTVLDCLNGLQGKCIVLANRVNYLKRLQRKYPFKSICLSGMSKTKKSKQERKEALRKLENGEVVCIFATYQLAKEGLDVPSLNNIILATPEKDETTIIQSIGRVGRKSDGKEFGNVIDFVDDFGMYKGWSRKRLGYYRKVGAEIMKGEFL